MHEPNSRIGPIAAVLGAILLFIGTWLHPMNADPNVPLAAFTEYAAAPHWVASHLIQLFGALLMGPAVVLMSRKMLAGPAAEWAILGMLGAVATIAVASALQAVDGVALKAAVDRWAASSGPARTLAFQSAFAVRQIEIGLASISSLLFGLTASLTGIALVLDRRYPRWLGLFALAGGVPTAFSGLVMAYTGFSGLAMDINLPASSALLLWLIAWGVLDWNYSPRRTV